MDTIKFLRSIGHAERVYIRCLTPKLTPQTELQARGLTYTNNKTGEIKKSTVEGYINLASGEFFHKYGKQYKPVTDGWGHLKNLNYQGYGVYFIVHHGGYKNSEITHGSTLFHESDRLTIDQQQKTIDRISSEFGKPTAVVKTKKSLHSYWSSTEKIPIDCLASYQRRWLQYSDCDDTSLSDPAQLMRLPGFDHLSWNFDTTDFDRVRCELLQLNDIRYSLGDFDRILPALEISQWASKSLEILASEASDTDMRSFAPYLDGYRENGRDGWDTAKCPAHNGESSDSLHIDRSTGGFICHAGCNSSAVYNAAKSRAIVAGKRLEVVSPDRQLAKEIADSLAMKSSRAPKLFGAELGDLLSVTANNFNVSTDIFTFILLSILGSQISPQVRLMINPGTNYQVPALRWCGLVGDSGVRKSPITETLMLPIKNAQRELAKDDSDRKTAYKLDSQKWKCSTNDEKRKLLDDGIPDYGLLVYVDELKGFFESMNSYRKGGDRQKWLSINNGGSIKVNRSGANTIYIHQSSIGIVGGIQPSVLEAMIKGDESAEDGLWSRFTFARIPRTKIEAFSDYPGSLSDLLSGVYTRLAEDKRQNYLSDESKPVWKAWHDLIEDRIFNEKNNLLCSVFSKINGIAARNALILHRTLAAISRDIPDQAISAEVIYQAIEWTKWELNQTLMEYQQLGLTDDPELSRILKFIDKFADKGWVSVRDVTQWWSDKSNRRSDTIRNFMSKIVGMGYAIANGESVDSSKYKIKVAVKSANIANKSDETHVYQHVEMLATVPTKRNTEAGERISSNGWGDVGNCANKTTNSNNVNVDRIVGNGANNLKPSVSNTPAIIADRSVGHSANTTRVLREKDSSDNVGNVGTFLDERKSSWSDNDELDNLRSMADSLAALTNLDEAEAIECLDDLYSIWIPTQMSEASKLLKTTNSIAFDRLTDLVVKRKYTQIDPASVVVENLAAASEEVW
jgi:Protein of unknown function (DUF3987)